MSRLKSKIRKWLAGGCVAAALVAGVSVAYADYGTSHILKGTNTNSPGFQYWLDSSVSSYGYGDVIKNAATNWSAVPNSTANLWEITDASLAQIKYFVVNGELGSGVFGATDYWYRNGTNIPWTSVQSGTNFNFARVRLDHKSQTDAGFAWEHRAKTAGHETGHALSLFHFENSPAHAGDHWMKSGKIALTAPTSVDADHLAYKY